MVGYKSQITNGIMIVKSIMGGWVEGGNNSALPVIIKY